MSHSIETKMAAWKVRVLVVVFEGGLSEPGGGNDAFVLIENNKIFVVMKHRLKDVTM